MKKLLSLAAVLLAVLISAGCSADKSAVPPRRTGATPMPVSLEELYTLESAVKEADLVALVRIGDWLGEASEGSFSYYMAEVLKTFKGSVAGDIVLVQDGNSLRTIDGFPLFTAGNELLLFLKQGVGAEYDNFYWMLGSFSAFFDAVRDGSGQLFYLDRFGVIGPSVGRENFIFDADKAEELKKAAVKSDPQAENYRYHFIFSAADVDPLLESAAKEE